MKTLNAPNQMNNVQETGQQNKTAMQKEKEFKETADRLKEFLEEAKKSGEEMQEMIEQETKVIGELTDEMGDMNQKLDELMELAREANAQMAEDAQAESEKEAEAIRNALGGSNETNVEVKTERLEPGDQVLRLDEKGEVTEGVFLGVIDGKGIIQMKPDDDLLSLTEKEINEAGFQKKK